MGHSPAKSGRWITPAVTSYGPKSVVAVIVETEHEADGISAGRRVHAMRRVHVCESHRRRDKWSQHRTQCFEDGFAFYDWLESELTGGRRIHVFTPNVTATLTLTGFWDRLEIHGCHYEGKEIPACGGPIEPPKDYDFQPADGSEISLPSESPPEPYEFSALVLGGPTEIVKAAIAGKSFLWTSFSQYVDPDENRIAEALHYAWVQTPALSGKLGGRKRAPMERSQMWCRFFCTLSDWWVKHEGGPWGVSVGSLAYSYLRRRLAPKTVLRHNHKVAGRIEEAAIYGGRRSVWFVGNIGSVAAWKVHSDTAPERSPHPQIDGMMHHHDIRSMYPFLLATERFPVHLLFVKPTLTVKQIGEYMQDYGVLAKVRVSSSIGEYPVKTTEGVRYPVGRFWTTLPGPELQLAIQAGEVEEVSSTAIYKLGRPFQKASEEMLAMRVKYRDLIEPAWEWFVKQLANSMSGKTAQKQYTWTPRPNVSAKERWGNWIRSEGKNKPIRHYRSISGLVCEMNEAEERIRPMGASYAYLTSYGRCMMRAIRAECPPRTVLQQDTDGIWTTAEASQYLYERRDPDSKTPGTLNRDHVAPVGRFFGPQHYWWGGNWILSGHAIPEVKPGTTIATVTEESVPLFTARSKPEPVVFVKTTDRPIGRIQAHGGIGEDGWVKPFFDWMLPTERQDGSDYVNPAAS